ncbi:trihelix transcription factor GTL2 [Cucumis sativus]|uniref:Myb-like domain-containing protein n=2 Tax=Cucumis sativus TaxID=3659 RepID=A0A0A0M3J3_CUCSA|nr:trihelix transcription factor GTL2 [Cucumis sativus]KAE8637484.1 hypothetical protein CSA_016966 [Cucumis sativus]
MFEGGSVSEQLHQFLTPRTTPPPPNSNSLPLIPLNFALHSPNFNFHPFDSYNATSTAHHHHQIHLPHHLLHHQSPNPHGDDKNDVKTTTTAAGSSLQVGVDLEVGRENSRSILMEDHHIIHHDQWSNDELLALLRIRSNIENCFPESTWEHVSRKLGEVGFRRTADKCKEKFEEESRYFNHINYNKNCRFLTHELNYNHHPNQDQDQDHLLLIHEGNGKPDDGGPTLVVVPEEGEEENQDKDGELHDDDEEEDLRNDEMRPGRNEEERNESSRSSSCQKSKKKRKMMRQKEFELLKGYCEEIVKKMMIQQEEIHSKLLQDMLKKEEEKVAKEEYWKKEQMERLHKELEVMAHEQAIAGDRQATIIEILNQITNSTTLISSSHESKKDLQNLLQSLNNYNNNNNIPNSTPSSSSLIQCQTSSSPNKKPPHENSNSFTSQNDPIKNPKNNPCLSTQILAPQDPNSFINNHPNPKSKEKLDHESEDLGKRWPRDEVLALVNVRCKMYNNTTTTNNQDESQSGGASLKAPLWERISQGMLQLGYKRSAKRCKEKWENINKYFRKTKDVNKKRSLDSRTCPYFHQLSTLYNQGGGNNNPLENCPNVSSENHSDHSENHLATSS